MTEKVFFHIFLRDSTSSGLNKSAVEIVENKNLIPFHGLLDSKKLVPYNLRLYPLPVSSKVSTSSLSIIYLELGRRGGQNLL